MTTISEVAIVFEGAAVVAGVWTDEVAEVKVEDDSCGTRTADTAIEEMEVATGLGEAAATLASFEDAATGKDTAAMLDASAVLVVWLWKTIDDVLLEELERVEDAEVVATTTLEEVEEASTTLVLELDAATTLVAPLPPRYVEEELPVGSSPARTHPVLTVKAAGHST